MIVCHIATSDFITEQIMNLFNSIVAAKRSDSKIILCGYFKINQVEYTVDKIIDINRFNQLFGIKLISRNDDIELKYAYYGVDNINKKDITSTLLEYFNLHNRLEINPNANLNDLFTDPFPNQSKKIFIGYTVNDVLYESIHDEFAGRLKIPIRISKTIRETDIITNDHLGPFRILHYENVLKHIPIKNVPSELLMNYRKLLENNMDLNEKIMTLIDI